jgi:RNA polymerase sigma-70 factor (ECF subfamily)
MSVDEQFRSDLIAATPALRAFAFSLTFDPDRCDDLVQDTLLRAWSKADRFELGSNLYAWLFTILRNRYYETLRRKGREVEDATGAIADRYLRTLPEQDSHMDFEDLRTALSELPAHQREAVLLVGAQGGSYEEAAQICGVEIGTIKSRVNRARVRLVELLKMESTMDLGPDAATKASLLSP